MAAEAKLDIPILTDAIDRRFVDGRSGEKPAALPASAVDRGLSAEREALIAELQTEIAASLFSLTDEIMRRTFAEMEASVFEQVSARLRSELPEIIDALLRARLADSGDY